MLEPAIMEVNVTLKIIAQNPTNFLDLKNSKM